MLRCAVEYFKIHIFGSWEHYRYKACRYNVIKEKAFFPPNNLEVTIECELTEYEITINNMILYKEMQNRQYLLFLTLSVLQYKLQSCKLAYTNPRTLSEGQIHVVMSLRFFIFTESLWVKFLRVRVILRVMMKCQDRDNRRHSLLQNNVCARYLVFLGTFTT